MITIDDIAAAVKSRCDANAAFIAAIPGLSWFARADEQATEPYAVFTIEPDGTPDYDTAGLMVAKYLLRMGVYSDQGKSGHDPQAIQLAMAGALPVTGWSALRDGKVMHCLPRPFGGRFSPVLRAARDVFLSQGQWLLMVSGATS